MRRVTALVSLLATSLCLNAAMAFCPTDMPNEIFCDDFETYCEGGGYPEPEQERCTVTDRAGGQALVQSVWFQTSGYETAGCFGTTMTLEDDVLGIIDGVTSGRYFGKIELGQQTIRDWQLSLPNEPPVLDIHRFVGNVFGEQYAAVAASDTDPLFVEFMFGANVGKLPSSSGFIELAFGDNPTNNNHLSRANTDYAKWPKLPCCNGTVTNGPWPVICAQGNPYPPIDPQAGCPSVDTDPPPVHQAIALGALAVLDTDPCHCGNFRHAPQNYHLTLYDGQLWWTLRHNSPVLSSGTVEPKDGAPMPPPGDVLPGDFALSSPDTGKSYNAVKLTILESTIKVELTTWLKASNGYVYIVTNTMDNIPRKYTGPFDRIRSGVGPGCELMPGTGWSTCKTFEGRGCLATPQGYFVDYDNFVLYGGYGYSVEGACCDAVDGACSMTVQEDCAGRWTKSGQRCENTTCCPRIYGDMDFDGSVDMTDFAMLQACISTGGGSISSACLCFDFNNDGAIGSADVGHFADCANGPGVPGDGSGACAGRGW